MSKINDSDLQLSKLAALILSIPPGRRPAVLQSAVSFRPDTSLEQSFSLGEIRASFAELWERKFKTPVPVKPLRFVMSPPLPIEITLEFNKLLFSRTAQDLAESIYALLLLLHSKAAKGLEQYSQLEMFGSASVPTRSTPKPRVGETVDNLEHLLAASMRFPTVYADPPWSYENRASRGAAANHYPTMTVDEICSQPIRQLITENAHLHLWTTNAFLREAFQVVEAWGFQFKSCFVWVKTEIGMGNYWRVSHEFLMLGVRGSLTFRDRTLPSWIEAHRTSHSRKPGVIRALIERVSPGPYLELFGREELPGSQWTVFGNQVERRLF